MPDTTMEHQPISPGTARTMGLSDKIKGGDRVWIAHPVDIRLSLPLPFGRYYLTLVAGPERRAEPRLSQERARHPLTTFGNFAFFFVSALAINAMAVVGMLVYSSVLKF